MKNSTFDPYHSIGKSACIRNSNNQIVKQAFADDWATMPVQDFVWIGETEHNVSRTGKVFFSLPLEEQIPVLEGDILGLYWNSTYSDQLIRQATTINPLPEFKMDNDLSGFTGRTSTEYHFPGSQTVDGHPGDHLVMAHAVRPMVFKVGPMTIFSLCHATCQLFFAFS